MATISYQLSMSIEHFSCRECYKIMKCIILSEANNRQSICSNTWWIDLLWIGPWNCFKSVTNTTEKFIHEIEYLIVHTVSRCIHVYCFDRSFNTVYCFVHGLSLIIDKHVIYTFWYPLNSIRILFRLKQID